MRDDTPLDTKRILGEKLQERYKTNDEKQLFLKLYNDLGFNPYTLHINFNNPDEVTDENYGLFTRGRGKSKISLNPNTAKDPVQRASTMYHELAHLGDAIVDPVHPLNLGDNPGHFSRINDEKELLLSLLEQNNIERGVPPDPQMVNNMPWLKDVAPLSSNRIANPWTKLIQKGRATPPELWNQIYSGDKDEN